MKKITITATENEAIITLEYKGKTYTQKCISTPTGARYEGCTFHDENEIPDCIAEEIESFTAYNLMRSLQKARN